MLSRAKIHCSKCVTYKWNSKADLYILSIKNMVVGAINAFPSSFYQHLMSFSILQMNYYSRSWGQSSGHECWIIQPLEAKTAIEAFQSLLTIVRGSVPFSIWWPFEALAHKQGSRSWALLMRNSFKLNLSLLWTLHCPNWILNFVETCWWHFDKLRTWTTSS